MLVKAANFSNLPGLKKNSIWQQPTYISTGVCFFKLALKVTYIYMYTNNTKIFCKSKLQKSKKFLTITKFLQADSYKIITKNNAPSNPES